VARRELGVARDGGRRPVRPGGPAAVG
jgi:hypothetical protein